MPTLKTVALLLALTVTSAGTGQRPAAPVPAGPQAVGTLDGFSAERLTRLDRLLQQYVDDGRVAGIVALVLRDGQPVYERAFGWGGAYGTTYKVDPDARLVLVLMIQLIPKTTDVLEKFPNLVYQALTEPVKRAP
jgi:CubicO group peptidase (beta-lactamase class C family)